MSNLKTNYAGLALSSPIVVGSSGLTNRVEKIIDLEKAGAGAVVLKSLFEEQILLEMNVLDTTSFPGAEEYVQHYLKSNFLTTYLDLIKDCKRYASIPVIASINCYSTESWIDFAHKIELAGADALELNLFPLHISKKYDEEKFLKNYISIIVKVSELTSLPLIIKIGQNYNNIVWFVDQLRASGAAAVVLFNRFYQPDINIDKMQISLTDALSDPSEMYNILRWTGIVSGQIPEIDIAASTGFHQPEAPIKAILAGASTVQVCSAVYKSGSKIISAMNKKMKEWMDENGFASIADFKGKLNYANIEKPEQYERIQFMKYISSKEKQ